MKIKRVNEMNQTDEVPTAEEFCENLDNELGEQWSDDYEELPKQMIEFAKLHVTAALKAAHSNMQLPDEDLDFTIESYPLSNIK